MIEYDKQKLKGVKHPSLVDCERIAYKKLADAKNGTIMLNKDTGLFNKILKAIGLH